MIARFLVEDGLKCEFLSEFPITTPTRATPCVVYFTSPFA